MVTPCSSILTIDGASVSNLLEALEFHAREKRDLIAFQFLASDSESAACLSFGDLHARVLEISSGLRMRTTRGDRALLMYPPSLEFICSFLGCLHAGVVPVPIYPPKTNRHMARVVRVAEDAGAATALTVEALQDKIIRFFAAAPEMNLTSVVATDSLIPPDTECLEHAFIDQTEPAFLQYTSGSTSSPKGVVVTHANIIANLEAIRQGAAATSDTVYVSWLPMFHDMGLVGTVLHPLALGVKAVLMAPNHFLKRPLSWIQAMSSHRATHTVAPDFAYALCARAGANSDLRGIDLSHLRVAWSGAEPVRASTLKKFEEVFSPYGFRCEAFQPSYGLAEATLMVTCDDVGRRPSVLVLSPNRLEQGIAETTTADRPHKTLVGCGTPRGDVEVVIVHPDKRSECPDGQVGEIWLAGPTIAAGYWNLTIATSQTFSAYTDKGSGPFLRTGDLGFLNDHQLYVTGRLKDLIIVGGRNIYPQDVESVIESTVPGLDANCCAVFELEMEGRNVVGTLIDCDRELGRTISIEKEAGAEPAGALIDELRQLVSQEWDIVLHVVAFARAGSFPRTSSGKVQRSACRELVETEKELLHVSWLGDRRPMQSATHLESPKVATKREIEEMPTVSSSIASSQSRADDLIKWIRSYAVDRLNSRLMDERKTIPPYIVLDFSKMGFFGLEVPQELGGLGLKTSDVLRVYEQLAAIDLTLALMVGLHNSLACNPLLRHGSAALKKQLAPDLASGRCLASFALSEAGAGSDPRSMRSTAVKQQGGWLLNGEKRWIGSGGLVTLFCRAVDNTGSPLGSMCVAIPSNTPGLRFGAEEMTMGVKAVTQTAIVCNNVFVPDSNVIGQPGEGLQIANDAMMNARLSIAAASVGVMKRCAQTSTRYASRRTISTGRLIDNPLSLVRIRELLANISIVESLVRCLAQMIDSGEEVAEEAYLISKILGPEFAWEAADRTMQMLGARGYVESSGVPQLLRDTRALRIFEGPTETLTMGVGARVLERPEILCNFLRTAFKDEDVAERLKEAAAHVDCYSRAKNAFSDPVAAASWARYRMGEISVAAVALGAAKYGGESSTDVIAHAEAAFMKAQQESVMGAPDSLNAESVVKIVEKYDVAIGEFQPMAEGENWSLDPVLFSTQQKLEFVGHSTKLQLSESQEQISPPVDSTESFEEVISEVVLGWLRETFGERHVPFSPETSFTKLGIDSLGRATIASQLEERLGAALPDELLYEYSSACELAQYLSLRREPRQFTSQRSPDLMPSVEFSSNRRSEARVSVAVESARRLPQAVSEVNPPLAQDTKVSDTLERYVKGARKYAELKQASAYFYHTELSDYESAWVANGDRRLLMLSSYAYLGLIKHPVLVRAAVDATQAYGTGHHGARVLAGNTPLHSSLERELAEVLAAEDVLVCSSGYVANVSAVAALLRAGDVVIGDDWNHASIVDGCKLSGARFLTFKHNDLQDLETRLKQVQGTHALVAIEGVYSMEGDIAPVPEVERLCKEYGALLLVDEAHSFGVLGATGKGVIEHFGMDPASIDIRTGSLSKSLSCSGGFVAGKAEVIDYLRHNVRGYIFSGSSSIAEVAASRAALEIVKEEPDRLQSLVSNAGVYRTALFEAGFELYGDGTPIIPIACKTDEIAFRMTGYCRTKNVFVTPIVYPAVPVTGARLRTCMTASHSRSDIDMAVEVLTSAAHDAGLPLAPR